MIDRAEVDQALGGLTLSLQKVQRIAEDYQKLLTQVKQLTEERDQLLTELTAVKAERDEYDNTIRFLTRKEYTITMEELEEMSQTGLGVKEIEELLNP